MDDPEFLQHGKEFLSDSRNKIKLHGLIAQRTRETFSLISNDVLPVDSGWSQDKFLERLKKYEDAISDLQTIGILISYWWMYDDCRNLLTLPAKQLASTLSSTSGNTGLIALRWYPILLLTYSSGIAAIAGGQYKNLYEIMHFETRDSSGRRSRVIKAIFENLSNVVDTFKTIPGHERNRLPLSEYLFEFFQPKIDDLLFLGADYEIAFDEFEVLLALEHAHINQKEHNSIWGPPGRFTWKLRGGDEGSPLHRVIRQAENQGKSWPPVQSGFFDNSIERFQEIAKEYTGWVSQFGF